MRVVVAMSGGVDSSVAALLLKQEGYEVIGISMKLRDPPADPSIKTSGCCSLEDMNDARRVCDDLQIPFYAINFKEEFKQKVIGPFVSEYLRGRTPNPCVLCNSEIKFDPLIAKTREIGASYLATGHYARVIQDPQTREYRLFKGKDPKKDQSYFLFSLGQKELAQILFPLGEMTKEEVRAIARAHQLKTKDKPESQEICFVPNDDPGTFIDHFVEDAQALQGDFVNEEGKFLGRHLGIHHYTLGQRRGTQVASGKRMYVQAIDPITRRIILAEDRALYQGSLIVSGLHWVGKVPSPEEEIRAKIRYRHEAVLCSVNPESSGKFKVQFAQEQRAITPGQAIVFYREDEVLGGGWIEKTLPSRDEPLEQNPR